MSETEPLVDLLRGAQQIFVFTGAGISTNSGIPDYRGPKGVWKTQQPVLYPDFMSKHEARCAYWQQKLEGWEGFRDAEPNDVHRAVVELERADKIAVVVTQNIDGLHGKAGTSEERLVELHGTNRAVECQSCHARSDPQAHFDAFRDSGEPPKCGCGGWLKPATISFGQSLNGEDLERAGAAAMASDLVVAMGSTLSVHPAASFPLLAMRAGASYVVINRGPTEHDRLCTLRLEGDVSELFAPAVAAALA